MRRGEGDQGDLLPPGIGEPDLLGASIGPDLDTTTIQACLKELREQCLYLHFDGVRYCFKKDPNITLLAEQEAEAVARNESRVHARIHHMLEERLAASEPSSGRDPEELLHRPGPLQGHLEPYACSPGSDDERPWSRVDKGESRRAPDIISSARAPAEL